MALTKRWRQRTAGDDGDGDDSIGVEGDVNDGGDDVDDSDVDGDNDKL